MLSLKLTQEHSNKNIFQKLQSKLIKTISNFCDTDSELFNSNLIYTLLCISITFLKFIGIILYKVDSNDLLNNLSDNIFKIINLTNFLLDKGMLSELMVIMFFFKNAMFLLLSIVIFFNQKDYHSNQRFNIKVLYQILFSFTFWITFPFEFEFGINSILSDRYSNSTSVLQSIYIAINYSNIFFTIIISLIYCLYLNKVELDPDNNDYLTRIDYNSEIMLFILKLLYSIIFSYNLIYNNEININIYLGIIFVFHFIFFLYFLFFGMYFNNLIQIIFTYLNLSCIYSIFSSFFIYNSSISDPDLIIFCGLILLYPITSYSYKKLILYYLGQVSYEIKSQYGITRYFIYLINLATRHNSSQKLLYYGTIKFHEKECLYNDCVCKLSEGSVLYIPKTKTKYIIENKDEEKGKEYSKVYILHLIKSLFEFHLKIEKEINVNLHILYCYYMNIYIGNFFYSLLHILNLQSAYKLTIQQKVSLERILQINNKILEQNLNKLEEDLEDVETSNPLIKKRRQYNMKDDKMNIDFNKIIEFYESINNLKTNIRLSIDNGFLFWNSIQMKMHLSTIKSHGLQFSYYNTKVEETYKKFINIYSGNKEVNLIFHNYQAYLFGNSHTSILYERNVDKIYHMKLYKKKYFSKNSTFVIANISHKTKAIIEKITENVVFFLGLNPLECLGQDVKILMPNYYKVRHSSFLDNHFKTGVNKILNSERYVFSQHIGKYTIPSKIIVKLSNSIKSIYYYGFLREHNVDYEYIVLSKQGEIILYSKGIYEILIKDFKSNDNYNYIQFICREYLDELENIFDSEYEISDLSQKDTFLEKYGFFRLNFGINKQIDDCLKSEMRNTKENHKENEVLYNHYREGNLPQVMMKIISRREDIKNDFFNKDKMKNGISYFCKKENINLCEEESLVMFKLYSKLVIDSSEYEDDLFEVENYINKLENSSHHNDSNSNRNIGLSTRSFKKKDKESNKLKQTNSIENGVYIKKKFIYHPNDQESVDEQALIEANFKNDVSINKRNTLNVENSSILSSNIKINENKTLSYDFLKKKFMEKDNSTISKGIILINTLIFVIIIIVLQILFNSFYIPRVDFLNFINEDYISVVNIYHQCLISKHNIDQQQLEREYKEYMQYKMNDSSYIGKGSIYENIISNISNFNNFYSNVTLVETSNFLKKGLNAIQKSPPKQRNIFFGFLFRNHIQYKDYSSISSNFSIKANLFQILNNLLIYIDMINQSISRIKVDIYTNKILSYNDIPLGLIKSKHIESIIYFSAYYNLYELLSLENILKLNKFFSLEFEDIIQQLIFENNHKNIYFLVIIGILSLLSLMSFGIILFFYYNQNRMISLLFSLDERIAKEIIFSIRSFKGILLEKEQEELNENDRSEKEDNDSINEFNKVNEKDKLIKEGSPQKKKGKTGNELDLDSEKNNNNKLEINQKLIKNKKSFILEINYLIYIKSFLLISLMLLITIIPMIYFLSNDYHDNKLMNLMYLLKSLKMTQSSIMIFYINFHFFTIDIYNTTKQEVYLNNHFLLKKDYIEFNTNSSQLLYSIINDLPNHDYFLKFYSKDVCAIENSFETPCLLNNPKGYKYYEDLYEELILSEMVNNRDISNINISDRNSYKNKNKTSTEEQIEYIDYLNNRFNSDTVGFLHVIFHFFYSNANKILDKYFLQIVSDYKLIYTNYFKLTFYFSIVLIALFLISNAIMIKRFNFYVNVEIKKLFSLIPQIVVLTNKGIYELFN